MTRINASQVKEVQVLPEGLPPDHLESPVQAIGKILLASVAEGQVITSANLRAFPDPPPLPAESMRAFSVNIPLAQCEQLYRGCRVDIRGDHEPESKALAAPVDEKIL